MCVMLHVFVECAHGPCCLLLRTGLVGIFLFVIVVCGLEQGY